MAAEIGGVVRKKLGDKEYFFGTITSDKLKGLTFVPVTETSRKTFLQENPDRGYQRPGSLSRMRVFKTFLKENPDSVVPPILLSARGNWVYQPGPHPDFGDLVVNGPAAIVDGQHRAGGYVGLFEGDLGVESSIRPVDFIVLPNLSVEEETREFVVVNNTQKGVPKSLTAYLNIELEDDDDVRVAWLLNTADDSPFKGRITRITMQKHHLFALHSVAKEIKRTFDVGLLSDLDAGTKLELMIRYWTTVADALPDEWADIQKLDDPESKGRGDFDFKLLELTGLIAWSVVAKHVLGRSFGEYSGMNWDNVKRLVGICAAVDWRKDGAYAGRTGAAGGPVIARDMERLLPPEVPTIE